MPGSDEATDGDRPDGGGSGAELVLGALGALLVLALVAFLGHQALVVREAGPEISVQVTRVEAAAAGFAVRVEVYNEGGTTAEGVVVSGHLTRGGRPVEQASTTVSYVPPDSVRTATLVFSADPRDGALTVGPEGYVLP